MKAPSLPETPRIKLPKLVKNTETNKMKPKYCNLNHNWKNVFLE